MQEKSTRIQISGRVNYEAEISALAAGHIISYLEKGNSSHSPMGSTEQYSGIGASIASAPLVTSPREFLDRTGARTNAEKIAALAGFLNQDQDNGFKPEEIKKLFGQAREPTPRNFPRDFAAAVKSGWVMESENGRYRLTNRGLEAVQDGFSTDSTVSSNRSRSRAPKTGTRAKNSSPKKKTEKPLSLASIDEVLTTMDGFPNYHQMKTNVDKMLWCLLFAQGAGINRLSNQEITWLTDALGAGIPSKQVSATFDSAQKKGLVNKSTSDNLIRILPAGESYVRNLGNGL